MAKKKELKIKLPALWLEQKKCLKRLGLLQKPERHLER